MTDIVLGIIAAELGFLLMCVVGIFVLDVYALHLRGKEPTQGSRTMRIMTPEELVAAGLDPKDFLNPTAKAPGAVEAAASGQYL